MPSTPLSSASVIITWETKIGHFRLKELPSDRYAELGHSNILSGM